MRSMDREQLDLATLHAAVANFVARVGFLFFSREAATEISALVLSIGPSKDSVCRHGQS